MQPARTAAPAQPDRLVSRTHPALM